MKAFLGILINLGDPGSIYLVLSESNCSLSDCVIYSTSIYYDDDSPIYKASIHAGIIDNTGGFMTVKLDHAHKNF